MAEKEQFSQSEHDVDPEKTSCMSIQKEMLPSKSVYFVYFGALGSFLPFSNIFLVSVGLSSDEAGFISGLSHAFSAIGCPLWGFIADWTNQRSLIFIVLCIGSAVTVVAKPFVAWKVNIDNHVFCQRYEDLQNTTSVSHQNFSITNERESDYAAQKTHFVNESSPLHLPPASDIVSKSTGGLWFDCTPPLAHFNSALFFVSLILFTIAEIFYTSLSGIVDSIIMNIIKTRPTKTGFGAQRVFGSISFAITSLSAGLAADDYAHSTLSKYTPVFCIALPFFFLLIPIGLISIKQGYNKPSNNTSRMLPRRASLDSRIQQTNKLDLIIKTFRNMRNTFFFFTVFVSGALDCVLQSFLFLLMDDDMEASKTSMGVAILVACTSEIFMFPLAGTIIKKFGSPLPCIELGIGCHFVRLLVLSYCENAWASIPVHILHSVTWALLWAGQVEYIDLISPPPIHSTMFGLLNGMYFGVPSVFGNMIGGVVYHQYGGRVLFRSGAILAGIWALVMFVCFHILVIFDTKIEANSGCGGGGTVEAVELVSLPQPEQRTIV